MRVFKNRAPRKLLGPKRDDLTEQWKTTRNEELYALYLPTNIFRASKLTRTRRVGHVEHMEERRGAYRVLVARPDGKRPLERPRHT